LQKENSLPKSSFDLKGKVVFLASNNIHKFQESRLVLAEHKVALGMLRVKTAEIQSDNLKEIAATSAKDAFNMCHLPTIVEDAGLFVETLKGFPGPYAAYAYKTLGNTGILRLMKNEANRKAKFQSVIAYYDGRVGTSFCFEGEVNGTITTSERTGDKTSGFGFDPIFQPDASTKTFAEMTAKEKNRFSHRAKAVNKFGQWYKTTQ
jgi:XTP/dITP diphosphohydrolase